MGKAGHRRKYLLIAGQWWSCPRGIKVDAVTANRVTRLLSLGCRKIKRRPENATLSRL